MVLPTLELLPVEQGSFEQYVALHDAALDKAYQSALDKLPQAEKISPDINLEKLSRDVREEREPRLKQKLKEYEERLSRFRDKPYQSPEQQRKEQIKFAQNFASRDILRIVLARGGVKMSAMNTAYQNMAATKQVTFLPNVFDDSCAVIARYVYTGSTGNKPLPPA